MLFHFDISLFTYQCFVLVFLRSSKRNAGMFSGMVRPTKAGGVLYVVCVLVGGTASGFRSHFP